MKKKRIRMIQIIFEQKIDFESQNFAHFDNFYCDRKTQKLFNGLVVGFGPKERPGRMYDSVR